MTYHSPVLRTLDYGYSSGRLDRREFVRALTAATVLAGFDGSTASALAGAERRAEELDTLATPRYGGTLKAALTGQPDQFDPATAGIYTSRQIYDNVFDNLVQMDAQGNIKPMLATSWRQLDRTTWEFDLVQNAVFHNGAPFTSADVAFTINRILDPRTGSFQASSLSQIKSVQVVDKYTVRFHLKYSYSPFLTLLSSRYGAFIQNETAVTTRDPRRQPIGTGPFKLKEWVTGDHITLVRHPHYWQPGRPYLDTIIFRGAPVDETRMAALRSGEFNWVDAVPLQDVSALSRGTNPAFVTSHVAGNPDFLGLVLDRPPFSNKQLRQAIAWAIDKQSILKVAYFGVGEVGSQEVAMGSPYYTTNDPYRNGPDLNKARQLMKDAGLSKGVQIQYLGLPQYPEALKTGEIVREQLAQIGIQMSITQMEVTVWVGLLVKRHYQITSIYASGTVDPDTFYNTELTSTGPYNFSGYKNPKLDALIRQARQASDVKQRKALYAQIRAIVWEDAPYIFVHYETYNYAMKPQVHGSQVLPTLQLYFKDVWIG
jgi:peptide/nickel transport system substrate-binding protein